MYPIEVSSNEVSRITQSKNQDVSESALINSTGSVSPPGDQEDVLRSAPNNSTGRPRRQAAIAGEETHIGTITSSRTFLLLLYL